MSNANWRLDFKQSLDFLRAYHGLHTPQQMLDALASVPMLPNEMYPDQDIMVFDHIQRAQTLRCKSGLERLADVIDGGMLPLGHDE